MKSRYAACLLLAWTWLAVFAAAIVVGQDERQTIEQRVRREVEAAFQARQELQRAELQKLREQLARVEQSIEARERIKDQIIDHRVEELLQPGLQWPTEEAVTHGRRGDVRPRVKEEASPVFSSAAAAGGKPENGPNALPDGVYAETLVWHALGARMEPVGRDEIPTENYRGGMRILEIRPGSPAAHAGLRVGDILVGIGQWETVSLETVFWILHRPDVRPVENSSQPVKVYVLRGQDTFYVELVFSVVKTEPAAH